MTHSLLMCRLMDKYRHYDGVIKFVIHDVIYNKLINIFYMVLHLETTFYFWKRKIGLLWHLEIVKYGLASHAYFCQSLTLNFIFFSKNQNSTFFFLMVTLIYVAIIFFVIGSWGIATKLLTRSRPHLWKKSSSNIWTYLWEI